MNFKNYKSALLIIGIFFTFYSSINAQAKYSLQAGTGIGFQGLGKINGGYFVESTSPHFDFKYSPIHYSIGANMKWKQIEFGIEYESINMKSDVTETLSLRRNESELDFSVFNLSFKYFPLKTKFHKLNPYLKGYLHQVIYVYTDKLTFVNAPTMVPITSRNSDYKPLLGIYVGAEYELIKRLDAYAQFGYGFETMQVGTKFTF